MPDYSDSTKYPNIGDTLAAQGQGFRIGEFDQTTFNPWVKQTSQGAGLGEGYCAGVVTDWLRRVLLAGQRGHREDRKFLTYNYEAVAKKESPQVQLRAQATAKRMGEAYEQTNKLQWWGLEGADTRSAEPNEWAGLADNMNMRGGKSKSTRKFTDLKLLTSMMKTYESADDWLADILGGSTASSPIEPGCGAKLGFSVPGKVGHAVAVWRRRTNLTQPDSYYFFDPNLGVFAFSHTGLESALAILFATDRGGRHKPYYKTCSSETATRMSYLVFGPAHCMDASPQRARDEEPPVDVVEPLGPNLLKVVEKIMALRGSQATPQVLDQLMQLLEGAISHLNARTRTPQEEALLGRLLPVAEKVRTAQLAQQNSSATGYAIADTGLSQPGNTSSVPELRATPQPRSSGLKGQLEGLLEDKGKHVAAFQSQTTGGPWVKLESEVAGQIKGIQNQALEQIQFKTWVKQGVKGDFAITKTNLETIVEFMK
jgi:hypothetical protein